MIRKLFIAALIGLQSTFGVYAQVADLLPMALQQFFDNNGNPLTSGTVTFYVPNTTTLKTTWQDANKAVVNPNPITLNAGGKPNTGKGIYGDGTYRQVVKDRLNNLVWDAVTAPPGASTGTLVGDGNLVGTILPWGGIVAPNQYAFSYGQELNRVTYSDLLIAITIAANVICTNASNTLTGLSDTTQIPVGAAIELTCVPAGTTVVSKTAATVVLNNPSNISLNTVGTFFPYGNGNGSTTFNVPDLRDLVIAGRPNMGGTDRGLLTTTYYGANPAATGARGGSQNHTLSVAELAAHTHPSSTLTDPGHIHATTPATPSVFSGAGAVAPGAGATNTIAMTVNSATTGITLSANTGSQGSSTPFATIQPTITLNYIIKITPDVNSSSASGVASLGGMTGVIACGTGLLCTGNVISTLASAAYNYFDRTVSADGTGTDISFLPPWIAPDGHTIDPSTCTSFKITMYGILNANYIDFGPQPMLQFSSNGTTFDITAGNYFSCVFAWGANDLMTGPLCYEGAPHVGGFLHVDINGSPNLGYSGTVEIQSAGTIGALATDTTYQSVNQRAGGPFANVAHGYWIGNTGSNIRGVRIRFSGTLPNISGRATLHGFCG